MSSVRFTVPDISFCRRAPSADVHYLLSYRLSFRSLSKQIGYFVSHQSRASETSFQTSCFALQSSKFSSKFHYTQMPLLLLFLYRNYFCFVRMSRLQFISRKLSTLFELIFNNRAWIFSQTVRVLMMQLKLY